jgi:hypothetical protein
VNAKELIEAARVEDLAHELRQAADSELGAACLRGAGGLQHGAQAGARNVIESFEISDDFVISFHSGSQRPLQCVCAFGIGATRYSNHSPAVPRLLSHLNQVRLNFLRLLTVAVGCYFQSGAFSFSYSFAWPKAYAQVDNFLFLSACLR